MQQSVKRPGSTSIKPGGRSEVFSIIKEFNRGRHVGSVLPTGSLPDLPPLARVYRSRVLPEGHPLAVVSGGETSAVSASSRSLKSEPQEPLKSAVSIDPSPEHGSSQAPSPSAVVSNPEVTPVSPAKPGLTKVDEVDDGDLG
jgi:hypothetical protein